MVRRPARLGELMSLRGEFPIMTVSSARRLNFSSSVV